MIGYWILKTNHLRSWPCWVKSLWMIMKNMPWFGRAALKELGKEYDYAFYVLARLDLKNENLHGARVNLNKPFLFVPIECVTIDCWVKFMRSLNVLMKPWSIKKNVLRWTLIMSNHMPPLVIWTWLVKIMRKAKALWEKHYQWIVVSRLHCWIWSVGAKKREDAKAIEYLAMTYQIQEAPKCCFHLVDCYIQLGFIN